MLKKKRTSSRTCRGRKWIVRFTLIKSSYNTVTRTYYQATIRGREVQRVMMHRRYGSRDVSKLMSPLPQQLPAHSACAWLPFKYVFQYACSLTSLLKSDCAAIDSLQSDKQLRARTCQPVNHVFLTSLLCTAYLCLSLPFLPAC